MSKIKQLQNNFTTVEQSKRLLELGVPADSADCYWNTICQKPMPMCQGILYSDKRNQFTKSNVPVWSVGRLMEIYEVCSGKVWENTVIEGYSKIDMLLEDFDNYECRLDFSKLEE